MAVQFALNSWSIPHVHHLLQECLGGWYIASKLNEPLDAVSGTEGDINAALAAACAWCNQWAPDSASEVPDGASNLCKMATIPDQHHEVEAELLDLVV